MNDVSVNAVKNNKKYYTLYTYYTAKRTPDKKVLSAIRLHVK